MSDILSPIQTARHTKTGARLYVVAIARRVDRSTYNAINTHAKDCGGRYSKFKGEGAIPGFQFSTAVMAAIFRTAVMDEFAEKAGTKTPPKTFIPPVIPSTPPSSLPSTTECDGILL